MFCNSFDLVCYKMYNISEKKKDRTKIYYLKRMFEKRNHFRIPNTNYTPIHMYMNAAKHCILSLTACLTAATVENTMLSDDLRCSTPFTDLTIFAMMGLNLQNTEIYLFISNFIIHTRGYQKVLSLRHFPHSDSTMLHT